MNKTKKKKKKSVVVNAKKYRLRLFFTHIETIAVEWLQNLGLCSSLA